MRLLPERRKRLYVVCLIYPCQEGKSKIMRSAPMRKLSAKTNSIELAKRTGLYTYVEEVDKNRDGSLVMRPSFEEVPAF